jgi:hypothetical protein
MASVSEVDDLTSVREVDNLVTVPIFILQTLGFVFLSALLLTVNLSGRVHRHPVFINFLCTWVLYSAFMSFL